jgi:hypothetical protein
LAEEIYTTSDISLGIRGYLIVNNSKEMTKTDRDKIVAEIMEYIKSAWEARTEPC